MNANLEGVPQDNPERKTGSRKKRRSSEHIGHTVMSVESDPRSSVRMKLERMLPLLDQDREMTNMDTLNRADVLALSETIMINGSSLRQIYETHLIGERGLRRLVSEHLNGGDVNKALKLEIVEREMDFERDPALKVVLPAQLVDDKNATLEQMLEKAADQLPAGSEEAAFFRAQAKFQAAEVNQQKKQRQYVDLAIASLIFILVSIVVILFLMR